MAAQDKKTLEEGLEFSPRFDGKGLIPCVTVSARTGKVLMLAYMNEEAIRKTLETGQAHYWSRSRKALWHKGATSGNIQKVISLAVDCDQDCLLMTVEMPVEDGKEKSCHTGRENCFYREIDLDSGQLKFIES